MVTAKAAAARQQSGAERLFPAADKTSEILSERIVNE